MQLNQEDIVYEDNHLIAVNKASGILVQGDITGDVSLVDRVKAFLKDKYQKPGNVFAGLVHRLDRPVSGIVLFAKTSKALERMNKAFHEREVQKTYLAIVTGNIPHEGKLCHWMIKDEQANKSFVYASPRDQARKAELSYKAVARLGNELLLEVVPRTGRAHQIRAQMAFIGAPIKGDVKYGYENPNPDKSICLHAAGLSFVHPVQKTLVKIKAALPKSEAWKNFAVDQGRRL